MVSVVLTEPTEFGALQAALQDAGYGCAGQLVNVPLSALEVSDEEQTANYGAIDRLEEIDDVVSVEHNMA